MLARSIKFEDECVETSTELEQLEEVGIQKVVENTNEILTRTTGCLFRILKKLKSDFELVEGEDSKVDDLKTLSYTTYDKALTAEYLAKEIQDALFSD